MLYIIVFILFYLFFGFLIALKIGKYKKIGFLKSLLVCILLSPFFGLLITENSALKNPKGCNWCGNNFNESIYCGVCGKDINGNSKIKQVITFTKQQF